MTYMGLPAVTVAAAENQRQAARLLSRRGIVAYLGEAEGLAVADMTAAVAELAHDHARRVRMSHEGRGLVDGLGARRVAEKLYGRQSGARG
jgi:spore coat polysaccharide biosynthesis predicted glycosyltransferase SpsG